MSKSTPSVLFYTADYLVGVIGMTWEEQGRYMYLLCIQQQKGHFDLAAIMPDCPETVLAKFERDEKGLYYNARMEEEMEKRYRYSESRRQNAKKGAVDKSVDKPVDKPVDNFSQSVDKSAYAEHMVSICGAYGQ